MQLFGSLLSAVLLAGAMATYTEVLVSSIHRRDVYRAIEHVRSFSNAIALHHRSNPQDSLLDWTEADGSCSDPTHSTPKACFAAGRCSDPTHTSWAACYAAGSCSDPTHTDQAGCEAAGVCSDPTHTDEASCTAPPTPAVWTPHQWSPGQWTPHQWVGATWKPLTAERRSLIIPPRDKAYSQEVEVGRITDRTPFGGAYSFWADGVSDIVQVRFDVVGRNQMARLLAYGLEGRNISVAPALSPAHGEDQDYEVRVDLQPGMANIMRHWTLANRTDEHTDFVMERPLRFSTESARCEAGSCSDPTHPREATCTAAGETWTDLGAGVGTKVACDAIAGGVWRTTPMIVTQIGACSDPTHTTAADCAAAGQTWGYRPEIDCNGMGLGIFPSQEGYLIRCADEGACSDPTHTDRTACEIAAETWTPALRASALSPYLRTR